VRFVFFAGGPKFASLEYAPLVTELLDRGHEVHLAFTKLKRGKPDRFLRGIDSTSPLLTFGVAPRRGGRRGWGTIALVVRVLADLARYAHPRYDRAPALRARMVNTATKTVRRSKLEPVGRALAARLAKRLAAASDAALSERTVQRLARLETAIPTGREIDDFLGELAPDAVLVTGVLKKTSQVEYVKSARQAGIPSGVCVASWDNLTNKGLIKVVPDRVFVWNETQRREATELHGVPSERVVATGAQLFDDWFARRPSTTGEEFARRVGLDPAHGYVLYLGSSAFITEGAGEVEFVHRWIEALRSSDDERVRALGVMVRPHPGVPRRWEQDDLERFGNAVVWPRVGGSAVGEDARTDFFDSLAHSAAVVGINTTAMIEAAVVGKSVLTVLAPEFAQESTLHFHYLLAENGGFLHVAPSLEEHARQLAQVLAGDESDAERRRAFVESFVRPHGLDRPATPIFADAVEELGRLRPDPPPRAPLRLRALLAAEAALVQASAGKRRRSGGEAGASASAARSNVSATTSAFSSDRSTRSG
jgi:hypothetical protein